MHRRYVPAAISSSPSGNMVDKSSVTNIVIIPEDEIKTFSRL